MSKKEEEEDISSSDEDLDNYKPQKEDSPNKFEEVRMAGGTGYDALAQHEASLLGEKCTIVFRLPNGTSFMQEFRMGHTVEWLKQAVEDKQGIQYHHQKLLLNGKLMIDPLSLSDVPGLVPNAENEVTVEEV
eukprot:NODE_6007_length_537_cov_57.674180_g5257_i0.p1 GENE.NODE_6007_length_537_cov_57.674180_g5257_i0~~NODE_6007_length_537_cov_57.674180_g5257_i0.p1  ORF type:complete len:132 (+),score=35.90 NODE_6007_length_537_cov_57.674180_g5257_i0:48-443(+)